MEKSDKIVIQEKQESLNSFQVENKQIQGNLQSTEQFDLPKNKAGTQYYDCVKIKVYLNEHYYIFSRFMILRILTMCRISKIDANKIAKDIKKSFIDEGKYEISQSELENRIFYFMQLRGCDSIFIERYKLTSEKRTPFIIFICGAPKVGKSIVSTYLAERLNISNMLQTNIVDLIMRSISDVAQTFEECNLFQKGISQVEAIKRYWQRCQKIQLGCRADINKALTEGKPVIIEGYDLIPSLYLRNKEENVSEDEKEKKIQILQNYITNSSTIKRKMKNLHEYNITNFENDNVQLINQTTTENNNAPLIIPILLILNSRDLKFNIENSKDIQNITDPLLRTQEIQSRLQLNLLIQQQLISQANLTTIIPINFHNIEQTLETIHEIFLQKLKMRDISNQDQI